VLLLLLLGLLRETRNRAGRIAGEQPFDEDARRHAEETVSMQMDGMQ